MFDALLILSFGGPEGPDDVLPFLRNVTAGRGVPEARLIEVAHQYDRFGGVSPLNGQIRDLAAAVTDELRRHHLDLPVYWGARNWHPYVNDTVQQMIDDGIRRALVFVPSPFSSYSGCRQYLQDMEAAARLPGAPALEKLRLFHNHPGFLEPVADHLATALAASTAASSAGAASGGPPAAESSPRVVFTAHSIPLSMAEVCSYEDQLRSAAGLVMDRVTGHDDPQSWDLVYQSRSGAPHVPWLEPDVCDHLRALAAQGITQVVLCPIGFTSDHMEVMFDLDTQAREAAAEVGITLTRAATVGTAPRFVAMVRELVEERLTGGPKLWLGPDGPWPDVCPDGHCIPTGRPKHSPTPG